MSNKLPKTAQQSKSQRKCIFCSGLPLTKEHLIPDWIPKVLNTERNVINHQNLRISITYDSNFVVFYPRVLKKAGHTFSKKLLVVCATCNNGWMSKLQNQTKPLLSSLMLDEPVTLQKKDILLLHKWIVMSTMVAEFDDLRFKQIPIEHLRNFKINQQVPEKWKIWIGRYKGDIVGYQHYGGRLMERIMINVEKRFAQTSTFTIGSLFIFVFSTDSDWIYKSFGNVYVDKLTQIHPMNRKGIFFRVEPINWHSLKYIEDDDILKLKSMDVIADSIPTGDNI